MGFIYWEYSHFEKSDNLAGPALDVSIRILRKWKLTWYTNCLYIRHVVIDMVYELLECLVAL